MPEVSYYNKLYQIQDIVLSLIDNLKTGFYLTGGTALGRVYLHHRFSEDLDLFINNAAEYSSEIKRIAKKLKDDFGTGFELITAAEDFTRIHINRDGVVLKIDMVNDISYRVGDLFIWDKYSKIDNPINILSNKIAALSRFAEKDVVDILFLSYTYEFIWEEIIKDAQEKDMWVNPIDISSIINTFPKDKFDEIKWKIKNDNDKFDNDLKIIAKDILLGKSNSLFKK
ncbi:MAG: nucleotidyl transferase AbiEii/AbiGii toxin family protein [Bacteroidia bacterium]|nr:nucleotidyl transferase AbiEii/AbiGii toxin family protein [Bacteroidia bacterium]